MVQGDMQNRDLVAQADIHVTGEAVVATVSLNAHEKHCFAWTLTADLF